MEITRLISDWQRGDKNAENALFEALYKRLHEIALHYMRTEPGGGSLGATGLIHEAYLRLGRSEDLHITDRTHFLALAARVMRRILIDRARARRSEKRGGEQAAIEIRDALVVTDQDADEILAVDRALEQLTRQSPRQSQLVELRYFAGYSIEESAAVLGVSTRTARREWQVARTRLKVAIDGSAAVS
jgi:RNA polymerase sigma factor (TIGR02999 family)